MDVQGEEDCTQLDSLTLTEILADASSMLDWEGQQFRTLVPTDPVRALSRMLGHLHSMPSLKDQPEMLAMLQTCELTILDQVFVHQYGNPKFSASPLLSSVPEKLLSMFAGVLLSSHAVTQGMGSAVAVVLSNLLLTTKFFSNWESELSEQMLGPSEKRAKAFALFCLLCTEGTLNKASLVDWLPSDSWEAVMRMASIMLDAAGDFQVSNPEFLAYVLTC